MFASDDYLVQLRACELGLGAMLLAEPHPQLATERRLERLSVELPNITRVLTLICPPSAATMPRVRAVVGPLTEALRAWGPPP